MSADGTWSEVGMCRLDGAIAATIDTITGRRDLDRSP